MPRIQKILPLCALLLACVAASHARADDSTLEERMSYKEFTRFGLDKLTPDQLRGINEWMKTHAQGCAPTAATGTQAAPAAVNAQNASPPDHVTSRIAGDFAGWEKGTVLTLANGQKWEVRDDEPLIASREKSPEVTVEKGLLGWTLSVAGHGEIAHVIPAGK